MKKILILPIVTAILVLLIVGCGGGGGGTGGGAPPGNNITISITAPSSLVFNGSTYTGDTGVSYGFGATVSGTTDTSVSWTVTSVSGAATTGATITGAGVFSASAPGTYTVVATSVADPSKIVAVNVVVTGIELPPPPPIQGTSGSSGGSGVPAPPI